MPWSSATQSIISRQQFKVSFYCLSPWALVGICTPHMLSPSFTVVANSLIQTLCRTAPVTMINISERKRRCRLFNRRLPVGRGRKFRPAQQAQLLWQPTPCLLRSVDALEAEPSFLVAPPLSAQTALQRLLWVRLLKPSFCLRACDYTAG